MPQIMDSLPLAGGDESSPVSIEIPEPAFATRRRGCLIRMLSAVQVLSVFLSWEGINHILLQFHLIQQSLPLLGGDTSHRTITASDTTSSAIRGNPH